MHIRGRSKKTGWMDGWLAVWLGPNITHVYAESLAEKPKYIFQGANIGNDW